ncbi:MAG: DEAD/DEAH box helicase family protein [Malacoplasma sp.]|nr:DEAD/DEAH box helicase family protein [Malacoplasma sp.]
MNFSYLQNIPELDKLYKILSGTSVNEPPYAQCTKYLENIEQLVRYAFASKNLKKKNVNNYEFIRLINDKDFKDFLGESEHYRKIYFIYLVGKDASINKDIDKESADLTFEFLKEITYVIFSKLNKFSEEDEVKYKYNPPTSFTEAKTRELYIDVNLRNAGYKINKYKDQQGYGKPGADEVCVEIKVLDLPNQKVGYADYVIYGKNGSPLAVIEAKRVSKSEEIGAQQSRDYADALMKNLNLSYRPIIYYTNGYDIKIQDRLGYPARKVWNFASMDDLELMIKRQLPGDKDARKPIIDKKIDESIINRSKLIEAVQEMIDSMNSNGKMRRKGLLVLPCGVGKTRTAVALSKILLKNDWAKNILFLADRNNLVSNAIKPFKKYISGTVSDISAENPNKDLKARICICTYQSILSYINKAEKEFSVGHFDLIIVDEAHRSIFDAYRAIFEYFDSFLIGLTATPSNKLDKSTYEILNLKKDEPTFSVKFEDAVNLGYLVSYKAFDKNSQILSKGVKYKDLSLEEQNQYDEENFGTDGEIYGNAFEKTFGGSGFFVNEPTIDCMFDDLFKYGLRVDSGKRIGKTLIFTSDKESADRIVERFKKTYPDLGDDFCQSIYSSKSKNKTIQDNFAKKDANPHIVVSVDMMDTGVDIPEIVNLVFFKYVRSRIKFDQMWGRGTRTCEDLYVISPSKDYFENKTKDDSRAPYKDKQGFFIFDYCNNFQFFDEHPEGNYPSTCLNLNQRLYEIFLYILQNLQDVKYQEKNEFKNFYNDLKLKLMKKISNLDINKIDVKSKLSYVDKFKDEKNWEYLSNAAIYNIKENLLPLIDINSNVDTSYKSWEYKLSKVQLSLLENNDDSKLQQNQMIQIAKALLTKASINDVCIKKEILKQIADEEYYKNLDFFKIENLKKELGPLMKYLKDSEDNKPIFTYFNDEIKTIERESKYDFDDFKSYEEKFISYLQKHYGEINSVTKILNLEKLDSNDLNELQNILDSLKSEGDKKLFENDADLILFIRKIIGLDRKLVDQKCATFLNEYSFNKDQRNFINLIIDFAIRNGNVENNDLANSQPLNDYKINEIFDNLEPLYNLISIFNDPLPTN